MLFTANKMSKLGEKFNRLVRFYRSSCTVCPLLIIFKRSFLDSNVRYFILHDHFSYVTWNTLMQTIIFSKLTAIFHSKRSYRKCVRGTTRVKVQSSRRREGGYSIYNEKWYVENVWSSSFSILVFASRIINVRFI